jgi:Tol biopolymer transport system component
MLMGVTRLVAVLVFLAGLIAALPAGAQVGSGRVVYVNPDGVFTVGPDGTDVRHVRPEGCDHTGPPCDWHSDPRWSPDGSRIAVTHGGRLLVMNADGSDPRVIASGPFDNLSLSEQPWSPDSTSVAVDIPELNYQSPPRSDIYVASIAGGPPRRVTFDSTPKDPPVWSPDGSKLAYAVFLSSRREIFVVDAAGGPPSQITPTGFEFVYNRDPSWSPDGQSLAFARGVETQPSRIFIVSRDGGGFRQVTSIPGEWPAWSPEGDRIAFTTRVNSSRVGGVWDRDIYAVDSDGSDLTRLTESSERHVRDVVPSWSPDGSRLLFTSENRQPASSEQAVYSMNADGTCEARVSPRRTGYDPYRSGYSADWQALPGGSTLEPRQCRDLVLTTRMTELGESHGVTFVATVQNDGTEPLEDVRLDVAPQNEATILTAAPSLGTCLKVARGITCQLGRLGRTARVDVTIRFVAHRVTPGGERGSTSWREIPVKSSLDAGAAGLGSIERGSLDIEFFLARCEVNLEGSGSLLGTPFDDELCGRLGPDRISGLDRNDLLWGGASNDILVGGSGDDKLYGGRGRDQLSGGAGRDLLAARDRQPGDVIACGPGRDRAVVDRRDRVAKDCERVTRR